MRGIGSVGAKSEKRKSRTMETKTAIYRDFEPHVAKKKRANGALETERNPERVSQGREEPAAAHAEQGLIEGEAVAMKILRLCLNPRLVACEYSEGGIAHRVLVRVGKSVLFAPGMELRAKRPVRQGENWTYEGQLPRFRGRWWVPSLAASDGPIRLRRRNVAVREAKPGSIRDWARKKAGITLRMTSRMSYLWHIKVILQGEKTPLLERAVTKRGKITNERSIARRAEAVELLEPDIGRPLTQQEVNLSLRQARELREL
jgi:hypothetical protein